VDSSVCGYRGEALFDQQLIPLGFAPKFRLLSAAKKIAKVGSMSVTGIFGQLFLDRA
jgi:hypothetical protein